MVTMFRFASIQFISFHTSQLQKRLTSKTDTEHLAKLRARDREQRLESLQKNIQKKKYSTSTPIKRTSQPMILRGGKEIIKKEEIKEDNQLVIWSRRRMHLTLRT